MDKQKAIQKINACLAIYKDPGAMTGEKEAAWERANFIAQKYGLKIVKKSEVERNDTLFRSYSFNDIINDILRRNQQRYTSIEFITIEWAPERVNGKRMRDLTRFMAMHGFIVNYRKDKNVILVKIRHDENNMKVATDLFLKWYKTLDKLAVAFNRELKDNLHIDGRDITGQSSSNLFSLLWNQALIGTKEGKTYDELMNAIPGMSYIIKDEYEILLSKVQEMVKEAKQIGR